MLDCNHIIIIDVFEVYAMNHTYYALPCFMFVTKRLQLLHCVLYSVNCKIDDCKITLRIRVEIN